MFVGAALALSILTAPLSWANDDETETLPNIEAKTLPVKIVRRSNSNKIYLIEDIKNRQPQVGRILLLKRDEEPFMAFRVLALYPEKQFIAAKRVRKYPGHRVLDDGESFTALEKVADLASLQTSAKDRADLKELETAEGLQPKHFDPELDSATSPAPENPEKDELQTTDDLNDTLTIEEGSIIDHHRHWITLGFGYLRNNGPPANPTSFYFSAGNLRYAYNVGQRLFVNKPRLQDSLSIEGGVYLYKSLGFVVTTDSYTAMSFAATLRYNLMPSEGFGFFFYTGIIKGFVLAATQQQDSGLAALSSILPALGGGLLFQIGPQWYTRIDMGLDTIGLNLVLRF